jgi:hypothetical protein
MASDYVWYGGGKTFWRVVANVGGADGAAVWSFADERVGLDKKLSSLETHDGELKVQCDDRFTTVSRVADAQARAMLKKAAFKPRPVQSHAFAVGREGTTYYLVDVPDNATPKTATKARVFIGKRGALKPLAVTRVDVDSGTDFLTAKGTFHTTRKLFEEENNVTAARRSPSRTSTIR